MIKKISAALTIIVVSAFFSGCSTIGGESQAGNYTTNDFISTNYQAADALLKQLNGKLSPSQPLIAATIVNIDQLDKSSTLGRLISEQVSSRFTQNNLNMIEMKFRNTVLMSNDQGELMLSHNIKDIAHSSNAQAVIVGTYATSDELVFINLKVIQPSTDIVMAVYNYALPKNATVRSMLYKPGDYN